MTDNLPVSLQKDDDFKNDPSDNEENYIFRVFDEPKTDYSIVREYYERQESLFTLSRNSKEYVFIFPSTQGNIFSRVSGK